MTRRLLILVSLVLAVDCSPAGAQTVADVLTFLVTNQSVQTGSVDFILPLDEIPSALMTLITTGDVA